ncbi:MAG: DUF4440 domain-containing protein [Silvibacterium sp.]|nr:DUF4440 domain-containing protein [Silvibacterium sp.]
MSSSLEASADKAGITAVRNAWRDAVAAGDAARLADLMAYDVVAVHADGRGTRGQDDVKKFLLNSFDRFDISGTIRSSDIVTHGMWAVEIDQVDLKRSQFGSGASTDTSLQAVFVFARQLDDSWKVARIIELPD